MGDSDMADDAADTVDDKDILPDLPQADEAAGGEDGG